MKIFIIPTSYPDRDNPQKDIFIYEQAKELARRGHEIIILHIKKKPSRDIFHTVDDTIDICDDGFAKRYVISQKTFLENKFRIINRDLFVKSVEKLYDYVKSIHGDPDVIYAHFSNWAGYASAIISQEYRVPLVTIEHFSQLMKPVISKAVKDGVSKAIENSAYFLCVSDGLRESIIKHIHPEKQLYVVPDMVDREFGFRPLREGKKFIICAIGNLIKRKDFETVITAFIKAFSSKDSVELRIGGDGPERDALERLVNSHQRQAQVLFLGRLTREQTIDEYERCNMFALASQFETFGLVYREALATGRPIVTTDHGGFSKNNWHDNYGFIVPVKDVDLFSNAMRNIFDNYSHYDLKKISEMCLNDCSAEMVGDLIEQYLSLASSKVIETK